MAISDKNTNAKGTSDANANNAAAGKMYATQIEIPSQSRPELIALLNQQMADNFTLFSHSKQAHWNVKGMNFYQLHLLFDRIAGSIEDFTDTIAERITALGGTASGTVQDAAANTSFEPFPTDSHDGKQYLMALRDRYAAYGGQVRRASVRSAELDDPTTQDLLITLTHPVEEALYLLEAMLQ